MALFKAFNYGIIDVPLKPSYDKTHLGKIGITWKEKV